MEKKMQRGIISEMVHTLSMDCISLNQLTSYLKKKERKKRLEKKEERKKERNYSKLWSLGEEGRGYPS